MSTYYGDYHVVRVKDLENDEWDFQVLHPESCSVWVGSKPDTWGQTVSYQCSFAQEVNNAGYDTIFPDGYEEGWYRVRVWIEEIPGTPFNSGFTDYDGGAEVETIKWTPYERKVEAKVEVGEVD